MAARRQAASAKALDTDGLKVLERVEFSDDEEEEEFKYEEVDENGEGDEDDADELADALASLQVRHKYGSPESTKNPSNAMTQVRPSVVDDFIRNFMIKAGLKRTLDSFNTEWYEMQSKGKLPAELSTAVPDIYLRNEELDAQARVLREQVDKMRVVAARAESTWDKFRKERDFHRMHHKRVVQEKNKLIDDLRRLRNHLRSYEPTIEELKKRHESAMKEKMLVKLERDRLKSRVKVLEEQVQNLSGQPAAPASSSRVDASASQASRGAPAKGSNIAGESKEGGRSATRTVRKAAVYPADDAGANPYQDIEFDPVAAESYLTRKTYKGHVNSVSACAFHPTKPVFATASDDETWRLWSVPDCELVMSGEGHNGWVSDLHFHPYGSHLVTSSGDATVKLWEFGQARCTHTFTDHTQAVWGCEFHYAGDFVASCSMDHTVRIWDLLAGKCRGTLRGHVDSVNAVTWQPYTSNVFSASSDKTISLWDGRTGLCVQTYYGHTNSCNHIAASKDGNMVVSCDADGYIKAWDVRMFAELGTIETGAHPVNKVAIDRSGKKVIAASDDATVKVIDLTDFSVVNSLAGHEGAVQTVAFAPNDAYFVSGSSDCTYRVWNA
jgi:WD40 repeat protein